MCKNCFGPKEWIQKKIFYKAASKLSRIVFLLYFETNVFKNNNVLLFLRLCKNCFGQWNEHLLITCFRITERINLKEGILWCSAFFLEHLKYLSWLSHLTWDAKWLALNSIPPLKDLWKKDFQQLFLYIQFDCGIQIALRYHFITYGSPVRRWVTALGSCVISLSLYTWDPQTVAAVGRPAVFLQTLGLHPLERSIE